jgi:hypothetical protein
VGANPTVIGLKSLFDTLCSTNEDVNKSTFIEDLFQGFASGVPNCHPFRARLIGSHVYHIFQSINHASARPELANTFSQIPLLQDQLRQQSQPSTGP